MLITAASKNSFLHLANQRLTILLLNVIASSGWHTDNSVLCVQITESLKIHFQEVLVNFGSWMKHKHLKNCSYTNSKFNWTSQTAGSNVENSQKLNLCMT